MKKSKTHIEPGYVWAPYIVVNGEGPSPEYNKFMSEYKKLHALCPECKSKKYEVTLVGYPFYRDRPEDYKNLNNCKCSDCGNNHTVHERVEL